MEMQPEDVDLTALLERLASLFRDHSSKAVLKANIPPDAARVHADSEQLYRILHNLCGNALRYSPAGGTVEIASRRDGLWIEISVGDQGPGIPAGQQGRLFQKFSRLTDDVSRRSKGTGLGLSICKGIVEAHGGRIWV
jgi:signal transduction histidine kinase